MDKKTYIEQKKENDKLVKECGFVFSAPGFTHDEWLAREEKGKNTRKMYVRHFISMFVVPFLGSIGRVWRKECEKGVKKALQGLVDKKLLNADDAVNVGMKIMKNIPVSSHYSHAFGLVVEKDFHKFAKCIEDKDYKTFYVKKPKK